MHPFSSLAIGIFVAGYITARWDLVTRLYELAIFAWDRGVFARAAKAFAALTLIFVLLIIAIERIAAHEASIVGLARAWMHTTDLRSTHVLYPTESLRKNSFGEEDPFKGVASYVIMVQDGSDLLRIFWPRSLARTTTPGIIVGWRNSALDLFVVTILEDAEIHHVENALRVGTLFRGSPYPVARLFDLCGRSAMHVLGTMNHPNPPPAFDPDILCTFNLSGSKFPQVYCPVETGLTIQHILFDPPNPVQMQYMSLEPISLALIGIVATPETTGALDPEEAAERHRVKQLVSKLKFHTVIRHTTTSKEKALNAILHQMNSSEELSGLLRKNSPFVGQRLKRGMSVSERVVESAQNLYTFAAVWIWTLFMTYIYPSLVLAFKLGIIGHRLVAEGLLQILEWQIPVHLLQLPEHLAGSGPLALKDMSACCQQVHLRLQQFSYYPIQYMLLQKRNATWSSIPTINSDYIRFYNSLWLVANDVIIGMALGSFINENAHATSSFLSYIITNYTIEGLKRMIRWLMSYPGGLKLNTELAAFLGDLFLWVIEYWSNSVINLILPHLPKIVYFISFTSFAGASMPIAIFSDLISLLTIHIYSFYIASARIFNWQLSIIISLFHLFRGKKRNVLRNRIDNCDYDLDQLLLGTILFTVLFFLLPTVIVFYLTFASARMAIIFLKATLDTYLAFLNHFPLFALMLRIKDPRRLPGGIHFKLLQPRARDLAQTPVSVSSSEEQEGSRVSYVSLTPSPLSLRQIFEQYFELGTRIKKHYLSPNVIFRLLTGRFVPPLGRGEMYGLQYSVLPRERVGIVEVWKGLNEGAVRTDDRREGNGLVNGLRKKGL